MRETNIGGQQKRQERILPGRGAERTCIGCRAQRRGRDLLRFVCTPQGEVILDASGHAPGRGVHACCDAMCLRKALTPAKLAMALKRPVTVPELESIYQEVRTLLYKRLAACLGLGQKAGAVISGYTLLQRALAQTRVLYLILAEDTAAGRAEEYRSWCTQYQVPHVTLLTKAELGRIIGKPSRSALGLTSPRFLGPLCTILTSLESVQVAARV